MRDEKKEEGTEKLSKDMIVLFFWMFTCVMVSAVLGTTSRNIKRRVVRISKPSRRFLILAYF